MNVVIVDDEPLAIDILVRKLGKIQNIVVVQTFTDARHALQAIPNLTVDLAFLDMEMPGISGVELAKQLQKQCAQLEFIFVTAFQQYAVEAFHLHALHYLLKPINQEDLQEALRRMPAIAETSKDAHLPMAYCFGAFHCIDQTGKRLHWSSVKTEELFSILLLYEKEGVEKWRLSEWLWSEATPDKAIQNVYTTVSRLKKTLQQHQFTCKISNMNGIYSLDRGNMNCDYAQYRQMKPRLLKQELDVNAVKDAEQCLLLLHNNLMDGRDYPWAREKAYQLAMEQEMLLQRLLEYYERIESPKSNDILRKINALYEDA